MPSCRGAGSNRRVVLRSVVVVSGGKQAALRASRRHVGKQKRLVVPSRAPFRCRPVRGVVRLIEAAFYRGRVRVGVRALCGL